MANVSVAVGMRASIARGCRITERVCANAQGYRALHAAGAGGSSFTGKEHAAEFGGTTLVP